MRPGQKQKFTVEYEVDAPYDKPISCVPGRKRLYAHLCAGTFALPYKPR